MRNVNASADAANTIGVLDSLDASDRLSNGLPSGGDRGGGGGNPSGGPMLGGGGAAEGYGPEDDDGTFGPIGPDGQPAGDGVSGRTRRATR